MKVGIFFLACISIVACGGAVANSSGAANTVANVASVTPTPKAADDLAVQTVTIDSPDGVKLVGSMYAAAKPDSPALLLLHQWQSDRHSYDDFAKQMQAHGFAVLSIDGRGFGESTKKADGSTIKPGRSDAEVKGMLGDVDAAFNYLAKQSNVDAKRVGIVGASYGSSLAIIYAADHRNVAAVALLSPGVNYFGNTPIGPAVQKYRENPLLFVAAEDDKESADAVRTVNPRNPDFTYPQKIYASGGHGTALLKVGAGDELEGFFTKTLNRK